MGRAVVLATGTVPVEAVDETKTLISRLEFWLHLSWLRPLLVK